MKSKVSFLVLVVCCVFFTRGFTGSDALASINSEALPLSFPALMAMGIGFIILIGAAILVPGIVCAWLFSRIFRKAGYPPALGFLMIVPFVNLVMLLILAFIDWPLYDKFAILSEQESDTLDEPIGSDIPAGEELRIKLNKNSLSQKKKAEPTASNKPVLPLPSESTDAPAASGIKADDTFHRVNLGAKDSSSDSGKAERAKKTPKAKKPTIQDAGSGGLNLEVPQEDASMPEPKKSVSKKPEGEADAEKQGIINSESSEAGEMPETKADELALPAVDDKAELSLPEMNETELKMPEIDEEKRKADKKKDEDI